MKNIKKILPAIALAGAGIIAIAGAGNASAYNYEKKVGYHNGTYSEDADPSDVAICYTLSNITMPISNLTYTVGISTSDGLDLSAVSKVDSSDASYGYTSSSSASGTISIVFNADGSSSEVTNCAHLNFSNALSSSSAFGEYTATLGRFSVNPSSYPVDTTNGKTIKLGYLLSVNSNGEPTQNSGVYQSEYWLKSSPSNYSSTIPSQYGHIEVTKNVKGNAANPDASFTFTANVSKKYASITGVDPDNQIDYYIYTGSGSPKECTFGVDCTFTLKHGQKAYIGCINATCSNDGHLVRNGVSYTITETNAQGHTPYVDGNTTSTNTTGSVDLDAAKKEHAFVNEKTNTIAGRFLNILPFIVLAILATVGVVTLRKANKKNEA